MKNLFPDSDFIKVLNISQRKLNQREKRNFYREICEKKIFISKMLNLIDLIC